MNARSRVKAHLMQLQIAALATGMSGCVGKGYDVVDPLPESYGYEPPVCGDIEINPSATATWNAEAQVLFVFPLPAPSPGPTYEYLTASTSDGTVVSASTDAGIVTLVLAPNSGVTLLSLTVQLSCDGEPDAIFVRTLNLSGTPTEGASVPVYTETL